VAHGGDPVSFGRDLTSSDFGQKGSPESEQEDELGHEGEEDQLIGEHAKADSPRPAKAGGWRATPYGNSLLAVFAVFLRQRGSPESKPVGAAHTDTGAEG
jgi:hypothetical protein